MSDWMKNMSPTVRALNADKLEPKVAETLKERKPRGRPEGELQDEIVSDLQRLGYLGAFFRPARVMRSGKETYETPVGGDGAGWPDVVAVGHGRVIVLECKSSTGRLGDAQLEWLRSWQQVPGATVSVVRPDNWPELRALL